MRAVVCSDYNESIVTEVDRPAPGPTEVLLEVRRVQLSVTECNLFRGEALTHGQSVAERLDSSSNARLFGHEFCGVIVEAGAEVRDLSVGDRVYAPGKIPCGTCVTCQRGYFHFCKNKENIGYERPGALSEYFTAPARSLERLPDDISDAEGAAMQPLASTVISLHDSEIDTGDVVVVMGLGVTGSQAAQLARIHGAGRVFGCDIVEDKLRIADRYGIETIDGRDQNAVDRILDETDGIGADVVIDAVGGHEERLTDGSDPIAQGFDMLREGGLILQIGHIADDISMSGRDLRDKCLTWRHPRRGNPTLGPNSTPGRFATSVVSDGRVTISDHITHELNGLDSFEKAVEITLNKAEYGALGPAQIVLQ